jgi:hypothetical protein
MPAHGDWYIFRAFPERIDAGQLAFIVNARVKSVLPYDSIECPPANDSGSAHCRLCNPENIEKSFHPLEEETIEVLDDQNAVKSVCY